MSKAYNPPTPKPDGLTGRRTRVRFTAVHRTMRDGPGTGCISVGTLRSESVVMVFDPATRIDGQPWNWIETADGRGGWVCTEGFVYEPVKADTTTVTAVEVPAVKAEPERPSQKELMRLLAVKFTEMAILMHQLADTEA